MFFVVVFTAPGGDAFAADGEPVNFLLFGGTAHLRCRVGIGDPNEPQAGWRRAFGNTQQYAAGLDCVVRERRAAVPHGHRGFRCANNDLGGTSRHKSARRRQPKHSANALNEIRKLDCVADVLYRNRSGLVAS
ncbi:hypothetical protein [Burkholderia cepacia]|uniref:hypothetical protein n=1 Tax=Burkholderia cepacia TaxID=292 RepID=UPI001CF20C97|nr:hypothetical protein [Burkholderia cepacia]MCA8353325.1 hypothetical protein [Burkholderia cepacia]